MPALRAVVARVGVACVVSVSCACSSPPPREPTPVGTLADLAVVATVDGHLAPPDAVVAGTGSHIQLHAVVTVTQPDGRRRRFADDQAVSLLRTGPTPAEGWDPERSGAIAFEWVAVQAALHSYDNTKPGHQITYLEREIDTPAQPPRSWLDTLLGHPRQPTDRAAAGWTLDVPRAAGTTRYRLRAAYGSGLTQAPAHGSATGASSRVYRVTRHDGDDLAGWMTAWEQLPYVYGSMPDQVEEFVGADCADLVVGACHRLGSRDIPYTYTQALLQWGDVVFDGYVSYGGAWFDRQKRPVQRLHVPRNTLIIWPTGGHVAVLTRDFDLEAGAPLGVIQAHPNVGGIAVGDTYYQMFRKKPDPGWKLDAVQLVRLRVPGSALSRTHSPPPALPAPLY